MSSELLTAAQLRQIKQLIDSSAADRTLIGSTERSYPATDGHRTLHDVARILDVNPATGSLRVVCLNLNTTPSGVQWLNPMHDPRTGHGMHVTPKPGMFGIYLNIGGQDFFWGMFGLPQTVGETLFLNNREPLPEGGVGVRTSAETKQVWSANLILIQAANFCKIVMKRANKTLDLLFYNLNLTSLAGSIRWATDLRSRLSYFQFKIRDRLPPIRTASGSSAKSDAAREFEFKAGAQELDDDNMWRASVSRVTGPGEGNTLETLEVARLRKLVRDYLERRGITSPQQILGNPTFNAVFGPFIQGSDTTLDLMTEAIVAGGIFTRLANPDGINGRVEVTPTEDSVENLVTGVITPLGAVNPSTLTADTERFIGGNRLEMVHTDPTTGEAVASIGTNLVRRARATQEVDGKDTSDLLFRVSMDRDGRLTINQTDEAAGIDEDDVGDPNPKSRTKWTLPALFRMVTESGPVDIDAGRGLRLSFSDGGLVLGSGIAGIFFTPEGDVEIRGRRLKFTSMEERDAFGSTPFQAEENELADFLKQERCQIIGPMENAIEQDLDREFGYDAKTGRYRNEPHFLPFPEDGIIRRDICGTALDDPYKTREAEVIAFFRRIDWRRRALLLERLVAYEPDRQLALDALLINKNAAAREETRRAQTPEERLATEVTDNGTSLQMSALGVTIKSNSRILLQSANRDLGFESNNPIIETRKTRGELRDEARDATGVPDFEAIDTDEVST